MPTPAPFVDHYDVLQLSPGADAEMIERAYRILAKRYHPDNQASGDAERFRQIRESFEVLSRPDSRAAFDVRRDEQDERRRGLVEWDMSNGGSEDPNVRSAILRLLYRARRSDPLNGGLGSVTLEDILGVPREHLDFPLWYLKKRGLLEVLQNGLLAITVDGIDRVEQDAAWLYPDRLLAGTRPEAGDEPISAMG